MIPLKYKISAALISLYIIAIFTPALTLSELIYGLSACTVAGNFLPAAAAAPYVIAIDPGHGGVDTGALSIADEYAVIDTTATFLYEMLAADPDFTPIYTRTDTDPESSRRAATANNAGADLFISIHANSDSHASSHGFECFPTPPGRTHHINALHFATLIAREMKNRGHHLRGESGTGVKYAYYSGKKKIIVDASDDKVRSMKSFGVLEKTNCPAVLVEQCFLSNHKDVADWAGETGCRKAATAYYNAIKAYFSLKNTT